MSKAQFILRIITSILFLAAAVLFYNISEGNRTLELIALVFLLVGVINIILVFLLKGIFDRLNKD
jgi:predicted membrane channel-forming protein YqfA (hemolysin III family)